MKTVKLFLFFIIYSICSICNSFAANPQKPELIDWRILLEAQSKYDNRDYNDALQGALKAKDIRRQNFDYQIFVVKEAISSLQVRKAGDQITSVLPIIKERNSTEAFEIISDLISRKDDSFFHNSINELVLYLENAKVYPEADFLCGQVYQSEGEYDLAMSFYNSAIKNSSFFDIYEMKYDVLYSMAEISSQQKLFKEFEEYLLNILSDDSSYFKNKTFETAILRTIDSKTDSNPLEKFFLLYRAENIYFAKAYFLLYKFYDSNSMNDKAVFSSALSSLTLFSHIYSIIKQRDPQYTYKNFSDFIVLLHSYSDLLEWAENNNIWESFTDFAILARKRGDELFAHQMLESIQSSVSNSYWKNKASKLLELN